MNRFSLRLPAIWRDFLRFLASPTPARPYGARNPRAWQIAGSLFGLNLLGLVLLLLVLPGWQWLTGIEGPAAFDAFPKHWLLPIAVFVAPPIEEIVFRGWLTGRPRALWLVLCLALGTAALFAVPASSAARVPIMLGLLAAAPIGWLILRKRGVPAWLARHARTAFYLSVVLFGVVHVFNYAAPTLLTLPMVLPQLWAGLTLGYTRSRAGLIPSIAVHAASNAVALGLVLLGA